MHRSGLFLAFIVLFQWCCSDDQSAPSKEIIHEMNLKRGDLISCGAAGQQFGLTSFHISGSTAVNNDFNLGLKLLHSFEYDEAEKVFARIIDEHPACAMAYWGVAMSNFHPLWTPPTEAELNKGSKAIEVAKSIKVKSEKETDYIQAISTYYSGWDILDHRSRCTRFEKAMETLHMKYPGDTEAALFYVLALDASADPGDKSFLKQKKAGSILDSLSLKEPNHPGIIHYTIHTFDVPELAALALPAARKYAAVAPSSAHALHMPSHIFTRLGLWDEAIRSNLASVSSAKCYAEAAGIKGHWDEELHGLDYLVYAYLQKGENDEAKKQVNYLSSMKEVFPVNFKVAYAFAAIPSRYVLENQLWKEASELYLRENFPWEKYPWQEAIIHFTRLMGFAHLGKNDSAKAELHSLNMLRDKLVELKDAYKANQVQIQIKAGQAWISMKEKKNEEALINMNLAADMEDKTEKHPVTPGEVIPARELLGDMLLQMGYHERASEAYQADLKNHPNRLNALRGARIAAQP